MFTHNPQEMTRIGVNGSDGTTCGWIVWLEAKKGTLFACFPFTFSPAKVVGLSLDLFGQKAFCLASYVHGAAKAAAAWAGSKSWSELAS